MMGNTKFAERAYEDAISLLTALADASPDVVGYRRDLASAHDGLAQLYEAIGKFDESERHSRDGIRLLAQLAAEEPDEADYRRQLGVLWNNLAIQFSRAGACKTHSTRMGRDWGSAAGSRPNFLTPRDFVSMNPSATPIAARCSGK